MEKPRDSDEQPLPPAPEQRGDPEDHAAEQASLDRDRQRDRGRRARDHHHLRAVQGEGRAQQREGAVRRAPGRGHRFRYPDVAVARLGRPAARRHPHLRGRRDGQLPPGFHDPAGDRRQRQRQRRHRQRQGQVPRRGRGRGHPQGRGRLP